MLWNHGGKLEEMSVGNNTIRAVALLFTGEEEDLEVPYDIEAQFDPSGKKMMAGTVDSTNIIQNGEFLSDEILASYLENEVAIFKMFSEELEASFQRAKV